MKVNGIVIKRMAKEDLNISHQLLIHKTKEAFTLVNLLKIKEVVKEGITIKQKMRFTKENGRVIRETEKE